MQNPVSKIRSLADILIKNDMAVGTYCAINLDDLPNAKCYYCEEEGIDKDCWGKDQYGYCICSDCGPRCSGCEQITFVEDLDSEFQCCLSCYDDFNEKANKEYESELQHQNDCKDLLM